MKRLDLILNGKGGVGKSFFAVNFVQFLKDKSIAHIAIDSDNENSTLKRFHPDVQFLDIANQRELDGIFRSLERANLVVGPLQRTENTVELSLVCDIEELYVRVKPLQSRILVVAINRDVGDALVFEELDEINGEEAFANAAFAIEDEVEPFHVLGGLMIRTCAMRGPREGFC